jgi:uncharacterized membrane protein
MRALVPLYVARSGASGTRLEVSTRDHADVTNLTRGGQIIMSNLVVVVFDDEVTAFEMRTALLKMQQQYLIELEDAVVVTRDKNGRTKLDQAVNLTSAGAVGGGFWGLLIGMIFLNPLLGAAVGAGAGALSGKLTDIGLSDQMMKDIGQSFKPGSSGLFLLVRRATVDKVLDGLKEFAGKGKLFKSSLEKDNENALRQALETNLATAP